jgi:hypothetical protein
MTEHSEYLKALKRSGLKVGDVVRMVRAAGSHEDGWLESWVDNMGHCVGNIYWIKQIEYNGSIIIDSLEGQDYSSETLNTLGYNYLFPFQIFEKINLPEIYTKDSFLSLLKE